MNSFPQETSSSRIPTAASTSPSTAIPQSRERRIGYGLRQPVAKKQSSPASVLPKSTRQPDNAHASHTAVQHTLPTAASSRLPPRSSSLARSSENASSTTYVLESISAGKLEQDSTKTLRRKPSVISNYVAQRAQTVPMKIATRANYQQARSGTSAPRHNFGLGFTNVATSSQLSDDNAGPTSAVTATHGSHVHDISRFQTPTPLSNYSITPSLIFTESPSALSHVQTPLSYASSSSPHIQSSPSLDRSQRTAASHTHFAGYATDFNETVHADESHMNLEKTSLDQDGSRQDFERMPSKPAADWHSTTRQQITHPPELAHLLLESEKNNSKSQTGIGKARLPRAGPIYRAQISQTELPPLDTLLEKSMQPSEVGMNQLRDKSQISPEGMQPQRSMVYAPQSVSDLGSPEQEPRSSTSESRSLEGSRHTTPARETSNSAKASRFGFLSRRNKADVHVSADDATKQNRKGPIAGTGHEGYGRHPARRRSSGSGNVPNSASTASPDSTTAHYLAVNSDKDSTLDDFLQQRLEPVYLRGEKHRLTRSESESTMEEDNGVLLLSSPRTVASSKSSMDNGTNTVPSDATAKDALSNQDQPEQTSRTSVHQGGLQAMSKSFGVDATSIRRPSTATELSPRKEESQLARPSSRSESLHNDENRHKKTAWSIFHKPSRPTPKWNPFQRSQPSNASEDSQSLCPRQSFSDTSEPQSSSRSAPPHYATFDSSRMLDFEELQNIMEEADRAYREWRPARKTGTTLMSTAPFSNQASIDRNSSDASSAISQSKESISACLDTKSTAQSSDGSDVETLEQARPSRLPQVGRIPRVVSRRDRLRQMPSTSYSRPFADSAQRPNYKTPPMSFIPVHPTGPMHDDPQQIVNSEAGPEFLRFKERKDSEASLTSSSNTSYFPTAAATALVPPVDAPLSPDEVWAEYDDLIDHVASQELSDAPETGRFDLQQSCSVFQSRQTSLHDERDDLCMSAQGSKSEQGIDAAINVYSSNVRSSHSAEACESNLRASNSRKKRVSWSHGHSADRESSHDSTRSSLLMKNDPMSMANLRFGALMVSKWLSFGRVLFSPAHYELEEAVCEERILVIDGLGKDWSYYCALTYSNASVYSIGPWASKTLNRNSLGGGLDQLPNYRHFMHADIGADFPFPRSFFSVVVFRFPAVASEAALRNAMSECKRVLRPGGHIEVSTLDLDLANMGNRARRMVRELKTRIHGADASVSLKSAADNVQSLLGRRGFENLNRCVVGVPAAGGISDSMDSSRDERSVGIMELMRDTSEKGDEHITKMVARVGRWWYSRCYEDAIVPHHDLSQSIWNDRGLLHECESLSTSFKLLICYAQKPLIAKRRAISL